MALRWFKAGNRNLRGKLSMSFYAGKHVEDTLHNFKPAILVRIVEAEMREQDIGG
jgi:hypothetical protein